MSEPTFECRGCGFSQVTTWEPLPCPCCRRFFNIGAVRVNADRGTVVDDGEVVSLSEVEAVDLPRIQIGDPFGSIDKLLGGGIVDGRGVYLLAGDAGIGKSSLLLQIVQQIARQKRRVLYVSGEETVQQVAGRARRFGKFDSRLMIVRENDLEEIMAHALECEAQVLVIDSINVLAVSSDATGEEFEVGGSSAVATAMRAIVDFSSKRDLPVLAINHVTKSGLAAGPNSAAHAADVVLFFEGKEGAAERTVSIPTKNRFGAAGGCARFVMGEAGLTPLETQESHSTTTVEPVAGT